MLLDRIKAPHHEQTMSYAGFEFLGLLACGVMFRLTQNGLNKSRSSFCTRPGINDQS